MGLIPGIGHGTFFSRDNVSFIAHELIFSVFNQPFQSNFSIHCLNDLFEHILYM